MKIKSRGIWALVIIVIGGVFLYLSSMAIAQNGRQTTANLQDGRFSLFQGKYDAVSDGVLLKDTPGIFKIDAETGNVWLFHCSSTKEGGWIAGWTPIEVK